MRRYLAVSLTVIRLCIGEKQQLAAQSASIFARPKHYSIYSRCQFFLLSIAAQSSTLGTAGILFLHRGAHLLAASAHRDWTRRRPGLTIPTFMSALFFKRLLQRPSQIASITPRS